MNQKIQRGLQAILSALVLLSGGLTLAGEPESQLPRVETSAKEGKVSINTATAEELVAYLKGIGIKKAEAIVSYRERYGAFTSIEQLQEVPGIGPALMERNQSLLKL